MESAAVFKIIITLFLVLDPLGNIPFFLSVLKAVPESRQRKVLLRELIIAYLVLLAFLFAGGSFIDLLGLQTGSISIAGAIILMIIAIRMIFPIPRHPGQDLEEEEPLVVPLAIPGVAGPSALATVLLLAKSQAGLATCLFALTCAWLACAAILIASPWFLKWLRHRGLIAMERLMGMVLVALAVQMFLDGLRSLHLFPSA